MSKRAAHGAGLDWGIAEETGKAVRWLSAYALPGVSALATMLTRIDGHTYRDLAPEIDDTDSGFLPAQTWRGAKSHNWPLTCGPALIDRVERLAHGTKMTLEATVYPFFLLPYVAWCAQYTDLAYDMHWCGTRMTLTASGPIFPSDVPTHADAAQVTCARATSCSGAVARANRVATVDPEAWQVLTQLMARDLAPDTETSRQGAGSVQSDND